MISGCHLLIYLTTGWILSGSGLPLFVALAGALTTIAARFASLPRNRLALTSLVLLLVLVQGLAFRSGFAVVRFEELPPVFHLGFGCALWSWLVVLSGGTRAMQGTGGTFHVALAGALILFWTGATLEIYRFEPFFVRGLAGVPLVLVLGGELCPLRRGHGRLLAVTLALALPLMGALGTASKGLSPQLYRWFDPASPVSLTAPSAPQRILSPSDTLADRSVVELRGEDDIRLDESVRFFLQFASRADFLEMTQRPLYLKASTVSAFEGANRIGPARVGRWIFDSDDGIADDITTLPEPPPDRRIAYSLWMKKDTAGRLPLLPGSDRLRADGVYHYAEGWFQLSPSLEPDWFGVAVAGRGRENGPVPIASAAAGARERLLGLPAAGWVGEVAELTRRVIEARPRDEIPFAIAEELHRRCEYALVYRNPRGLSPVENFLFGERRGHCELFSAAALMMLRSAGIPSRIAYGYTGGAANEGRLSVAFRGSDRHAWIEILGRDGTWTRFDPTPGEVGPSRRPASGSGTDIPWELAEIDPGLFRGLGEFESSIRERSPLEDLLGKVLDWTSRHFLLLAIWIAGGFFGLWWAVHRRDRSSEPDKSSGIGRYGHASVSRESSHPELARAIERLAGRVGIPPLPGRTLRETVEALERRHFSNGVLDSAVDYLYRVRYAGHPPDRARERLMLRQIRLLEKTVNGFSPPG